MNEVPAEVQANIPNLRLLLLDVDGVLTDGRVGFLTGGGEIKFFSIYDGIALRMLQKAGWKVGFLSGRTSKVVEERAQELEVEIVVQGSNDKAGDLEEILKSTGLQASEVAYVGDDLPDIPVLKRVGFSAAPANAAPQVKACVHYVSQRGGGTGAVREMVELLLRASGKWDSLVAGWEVDPL